MTGFPFRINKSFVNYEYNHPITIPRAYSPDLEKGGFLVEDVKVICPNGREMDGYIFSARAGWGQYYQIRIYGSEKDPLNCLPIGKTIFVKFEKSGNRVRIDLLSMD